jgi:hypothetical protein
VGLATRVSDCVGCGSRAIGYGRLPVSTFLIQTPANRPGLDRTIMDGCMAHRPLLPTSLIWKEGPIRRSRLFSFADYPAQQPYSCMMIDIMPSELPHIVYLVV